MAASPEWDRQALDARFSYQTKEKESRLKECLAKAVSRPAYESFADEAAAELSVYHYLERRPFLNSREQFVAALDELATSQPPNLAEFDQKRFNEYRLTLIRRLRHEFGRDHENSGPAPEPSRADL
jgi:hypothetical protein